MREPRECGGGRQFVHAETQGRFDLVIAGGGLVGAAFACAVCAALGRVGAPPARIAVVERRPASLKKGFDVPSIALSRRSVAIFKTLELWQLLAPRAVPMRRVRIGLGEYRHTLTLDGAEQGWDSLGQVLELPHFLHTLQEGARTAGASFFCPEEIAQVQPLAGEGWELRCSSGANLRTPLLVVAEGAASNLRQRLGITGLHKDYGSDALLLNATAEGVSAGEAWECFLRDGSFALLPLPPFPRTSTAGRVVLIRVAPREKCEVLLSRGAEGLARQCEHLPVFGGAVRLGRVGCCHRRPLRMWIADEQQRRGLVLLGDAAHSLHPIGAQGFNLAMRDLSVLAQMLADARVRGESWADAALLRRYELRRRHDQRRVRQLSDVLPGLLAGDLSLPAPLLAAGMKALDLPTPLKSWFVRRVAGF